MNAEQWTQEQINAEFDYRMEERLALLCGRDESTAEQLAIAMQEADDACEELKRQAQPEIRRRKIEL